LFFYAERREQAMGGIYQNKWAKQIARQHKEHMERLKDHRDKMKGHRDARETAAAPGPQMRRMKLTAAEKQKLKAKILESQGLQSDKGMRRK
jgi:hypothetical protein